MPSLFDTLGTPQSVQPLAAPTEASQQIQKITDVGSSGKAAVAPQAKRSALGEAGALDEVQAGLKQLDAQQTQTLQQQQLQAHELDMEDMIQNRQLDQGVLDMRSKALEDANKLYGELARSREALSTERAASQLEQLGVATRLSTDRYVFNLQLEGMKNRLSNQFAFDEALQASIMGADYELAAQDAAFQIKLNDEKNAWLEKLGKMDIDSALRYSGMSDAAFRTAAIAKGVSTLAEAGATYYAKNKDEDEDEE